jgi:transcriptional regulator with XRE-family HTH domain
MDILDTFANNVKKYRLERGYSQEKLAEIAELHRTYISAVERCRRSIALENIQKIANALQIKTYLLFMQEDNNEEE